MLVIDELSTGLLTHACWDESPPCLLVENLGWESGFRGSGLLPGDRIVAVDGVPLARPPDGAAQGMLLGQYQEPLHWQKNHRRENDRVRLTVRRKQSPQGWQALEVEGSLRAKRSYRTAENRALVWENGPDTYERDGFNDAWTAWLEALQKRVRNTFCQARFRVGLTTRYEYKSLLEERPRVERMISRYPGPFAEAVRSDFEATLERLRGPIYALGEAELAYRKADEERAAAITELAKQAWTTALDTARTETITAFPAQHPIHGQREAVAGKCVVLERLPTRQWISEAGHGWFFAGDASQGRYFLDMESLGSIRMLRALRRYTKLVSPMIREEYTLLGRVLPKPRLVMVNGSSTWGLQIELLAALIGGALFVDVRQGEGEISAFAGEEGLLKPRTALPADDATPQAVLACMIDCIKAGDLTVWRQLFADWLVRANHDGTPQVCYRMQHASDDDFERSRASFAGRLWDARVAWIGEPRVITSGNEFAGAPRVEEVEAEIEHVGQFEGEYRGFLDVTVHRWWVLQRIDNGPWRIATLQGI
ncbi:hypothetical protein [Hyalangium sp.]|uniref:hypothetical protein n=1 Tax=Hyalangium sp. TaxID=2028555 RepID=UPI002D5C79F4|nr:hypothetical protein [Hyalangium sp.]HYH99419.1 hypothetical protein [Hyalangium sp.]